MSKLLIDIGGTKCSVAQSDIVDERETFATNSLAGPTQIMERVLDIAKTFQGSGKSFDGAGVSFGGPFDFDNQKVKRSVHVSGWEDFSFSEWSKEFLGVPAVADNDGNLGALGEFVSRGSTSQSLVYVTISTGVGAGFVVNGNLYRGIDSLALEVGHTIIDKDGLPDELGNQGTLERYASGYWLKKDYGEEAAKLLLDQQFLEEYSERLAIGLSNLLRILNPEHLILGGGITQAGDRLEEALHKNLSRLLEGSRTKLEFSTLGNLNVLLGAKELAENELRK
jgi:glucokinase